MGLPLLPDPWALTFLIFLIFFFWTETPQGWSWNGLGSQAEHRPVRLGQEAGDTPAHLLVLRPLKHFTPCEGTVQLLDCFTVVLKFLG